MTASEHNDGEKPNPTMEKNEAVGENRQPPHLTHELVYNPAGQIRSWLRYTAEILAAWPAIVIGIGSLLFSFKLGERCVAIIVGLLALILGITRLIWLFNKQRQVDFLAEKVSFAIKTLVNFPKGSNEETDKDKERRKQEWEQRWEERFTNWRNSVSTKLADRLFFTRADQLHFDRLGFVPIIIMTNDSNRDRLLGQLKLKLDRLRELILLIQERR